MTPYLPDPDSLTDVDKYWVGYFRADGSVSRGIGQFGQIHREPVAAFVSYLGLADERVKSYRNKSVKDQDYWVHSMSYRAIGRVYGLMGVKSQLVDQTIYDSLHFWRGLIDGDGSLSGPEARIAFLALCGSRVDVVKFSEFVNQSIDFLPKVFPHGSIFMCTIWGDKAKTLVSLLYKDQFSALEYKKLRAQAIIDRPYSGRYLSRELRR